VLQEPRLGGKRSINRRVNRFHNAIQSARDIVVPESEHAISFLFQPTRAPIVARLVRFFAMLRAVKFDQQTRGHAGKIGDVGTDWHLPPEMRTFELKFPQFAP
jgi:hypothetical protein